MKITITKNQKNILLNRSELVGTIELSGATTSNNDLRAELAKGKDASLIVIKKIQGQYGGNKARFNAVIYDTLKDRNIVEKTTKHQRDGTTNEAKKAAVPGEA